MFIFSTRVEMKKNKEISADEIKTNGNREKEDRIELNTRAREIRLIARECECFASVCCCYANICQTTIFSIVFGYDRYTPFYMVYECVWVVGMKWKVISWLFIFCVAKAQHFVPIHAVHGETETLTPVQATYLLYSTCMHLARVRLRCACYTKAENISRVSRA